MIDLPHENELSELLSESYGSSLGLNLTIESVRGHNKNSESHKLRTEQGEYHLKIYSPSTDAKSIAEAVRIAAACRERAPVPEIIPTDNGAPFVSTPYGIFLVSVWITGERLAGSERERSEAAQGLARLHAVFREHTQLAREIANPGALSLIEFDRVYNNLHGSELRGLIENELEFLRSELEANDSDTEVISKLPKQMTHYDFHPGNLLFQSERLVGVLDFDAARVSQRVRDVGFAAVRFSLVGEHDESELGERIAHFVAQYEELCPLSDLERSALCACYRDECLSRLSYIIRSFAESGETTWLSEFSNNIFRLKAITNLYRLFLNSY